MKKMKGWKTSTKILVIFLFMLIAIIVSTLIQLAVNLSIKPIATGYDKTNGVNYNQSGLTELYHDYDKARRYGYDIDPTTLEDDYVLSKLEGSINTINGRFDCADFTANEMIAFYLENQEILGDKAKEGIKECLLGFKYWMDQGGQDSLCIWSENHQIMYSATEYLVSITFPNETFKIDGKSSNEHKDMALERINSWMDLRYYYGFSEYYSNNYYPEDFAPMSTFIQFADESDPEIETMVRKMTIIMDLLWNDIATQANKMEKDGITYYTFMSASGRMYFDNKSSDDTGNRLRVFADFILENKTNMSSETVNGVIKDVPYYEISTNHFFMTFKHMVEADKYHLPKAIKEIFNDNSETKIIK